MNLKKAKGKALRVLDFDIENRPLSYWIPDRPTAEVTAVACSWVGEDGVSCWLLTKEDKSAIDMLTAFYSYYEEADMVTGHYIRKHDLPILNGALVEYDLPPLTEKLTSDTKLDLIRWKDLPASQEALAGTFGLPEAKHHMSQPEWREANRLTDEGLDKTHKRVTDDVIQHKALRARLIEAGLLKAPRMWRP